MAGGAEVASADGAGGVSPVRGSGPRGLRILRCVEGMDIALHESAQHMKPSREAGSDAYILRLFPLWFAKFSSLQGLPSSSSIIYVEKNCPVFELQVLSELVKVSSGQVS